uniref:NADH dehydrogenase subunit 5 n=1 Tax=Urolabida histrionica TaxID=2880905 RepID=UPI001D11F5BB|nr:NADH dehydrogenase subunit 5 [Urolabida histrionica]UCC46137.1 NADH dehydrogenase subunit 5 [Urolabida histrionica]
MYMIYYFWSFMFFLFFLFTFLYFMWLISFDYIIFMEWDVLMLSSGSVSMSLLLDWMSLLFMSCVFLISSMVIFYSKDYMSSDIFNYRFLLLIVLFILSMFLLIISPNLISIFLGWDGLGLVSYCLVIYFGNYKSYNAGMLTIMTNRIGDVFILLSLYFMYNFGDWSYMFYMLYWDSYFSLMLVMVVLASFTKSAQIPFSSWLPAAMAAPTPVSSLVHSSTLVTAGVYLLIRFFNFFSDLDMSFYMFMSTITMFMAGLGANFEYDLSKIIALSTLSQLGMMMTILFMGSSLASFYHLLVHAFFKSLLFLCAGLIIHCMCDSQDIRHMGNLIYQIPFSCSCFCVSTFSLCGLPFLSGFYSKDYIVEYTSNGSSNMGLFVLLLVSIGLTASYSFRLIYYCIGNYSGLYTYYNCTESSHMMFSMFLLVFLGILGGASLSWFIVPFSLFMSSLFLKLTPLFFVFLGIYYGYFMSSFNWFSMFSSSLMNFIYSFTGNLWYLPSFSTIFLNYNTLMVSKSYWMFNDFMWGEYLISNFFPRMNLSLFNGMVYIEFRNFKTYMLLFMFVILFMLLI